MDLQTGLVWGTVNLGNGGPTAQWSFSSAQQLAEASEECGYTDWRLPTRAELESLAAHGGLEHFDESFHAVSYWSTTGQGQKRWVVNIETGESALVWAGGPAESYFPFVGVREADLGGGGGAAVVDCITYDTSGGPNGDKHLSVRVTVTDDAANPIDNATVSITVFHDGTVYASTDSTTDGAGEASFSFGNAPAGVYDVDVIDIEPGLDFDGTEPVNAFNKGTDPAPASFGC